MSTVRTRFACRRRTAAEWAALNEVLLLGEWGVETDLLPDGVKAKVGDGVTDWNGLGYAIDTTASGGGGAVDSVNGQTGVVVLDAGDVGAATTAQGATADSAVQPGDLATVATTGAYADLGGKPTLGTAAATASSDYATAAQGAKADSAVQPADLSGYVPTTRTVNGHALSANVTVTASDVGAPSGSGNSTGINTGDQTSIVGITGTLAQFNTALTGADFATGGGTVTGASSGTNTGDQDLSGYGLKAGANTWTLTQTFTLAPVFTDQSGTRTALGLGTAAVVDTGTSGTKVPLLDAANTWTLLQTYTVGVSLDPGATGTVSAPPIFLAGDTTTGWYRDQANRWTFTCNGAARATFASGSVRVASAVVIGFSSNNSSPTVADTGFARNAARVAEVNNGTGGTFGDMKLRNLLAAGGNGSFVQVPTMTVTNLAAAATAGFGALAAVSDANATTARSIVAGGGANKVLVMSDGTNWLIMG